MAASKPKAAQAAAVRAARQQQGVGIVGMARLVAAFGAIVVVTKPWANFPDSVIPAARC